MMYRIQLTLLAAFLVSHLSCNGSNPFSQSADSSGNLKISIKSSGMGRLSKSAANITITKAQVVIHEIELETVVGDSMDFEFEQPFVQDLAIDTTVQQIITVDVPPGIYEEMEIDIAALTARDSVLYAQNPDLQDLSIRIEGTVDSDSLTAFVFTSDLNVEQETEFDPPLVLTDSSATNVVINVDVSLWFVDGNGSMLDPRDPANQRRIEKNIKNSFRVFEDRDDDGEDDSDDDSDGSDDDDGDDDGGP